MVDKDIYGTAEINEDSYLLISSAYNKSIIIVVSTNYSCVLILSEQKVTSTYSISDIVSR